MESLIIITKFSFYSCYSCCAAHLVNKNAFQCMFYEIPAAAYHPNNLLCNVRTLHDSNIRSHDSTLSVNFAPNLREIETFKTSHPEKVQLDGNFKLFLFTNGTVCVK